MISLLLLLLVIGGCNGSVMAPATRQAQAERFMTAPANFTYAHMIETLVHARPASSGALRLAVYSRDLGTLEDALDPASIRAVSGERIVLDLVGYPVDHDASPADYRAATFVVDYDTPVVEALAAQILAEDNARPTPEQIARFVHGFIEPTMSRGFDFASTVARRKAGDCTEYAVLYAALARRLGYGARVVFGLAIVAGEDGTYQAYGHAWNEVAGTNGWSLIDSTGLDTDVPVSHLRSSYLEDESAAYARSFIKWLNSSIYRIEILGSPVP